MSIKIAITNEKGGCGKTTSAVNISAILAERGYRVLLADVDPQSYATMYYGLYNADDPSLYDAITGVWPVNDAIVKTVFGVDVLKSNTKLMKLEEELIDKSYGLSLSDQYWIKEKGSSLEWAEINFFTNDFSRDIGDILFSGHSSSAKIDLMSPDNTSDGWLRKKWTIIDGKRCLIKGGSGVTQQEPYNEVIASELMEKLNIPHVPYRIIMQGDYPYSVCEDFIDADTELISADYIMKSQKKANHLTTYQHLPYGTYVVHQTKGGNGRQLVADFDVSISEDGKVYSYDLVNIQKNAQLKIVKTSEDGVVEGIHFRVTRLEDML